METNEVINKDFDYIEMNAIKGKLKSDKYNQNTEFDYWESYKVLVNKKCIMYVDSGTYHNQPMYIVYMNWGTKDYHSFWISPTTYERFKQHLNYINI